MRIIDAGSFGDVGESAIAIVAIERIRAIVGHVNIDVAIVVEITDGAAHAVAGIAQAG